MISQRLKDTIRRRLPARTAVHRILSGSLKGARIHTSWHDYPGAILGTTERPLIKWLAANVDTGETWLDIGGHYGYTAIALSKFTGPSGRVFAFEPVIRTAGCLARTRDLNRLDHLTVVPLALGADAEFQTMVLPMIRGMADSTAIAAESSERIFAIALDSIWTSLCEKDSRIHGVKIDVQGLELQVLLGMREQLSRWNPKLVIEFHKGVDRGEVLNLLATCGYSPVYQPIGDAPAVAIADDMSYVFLPEEGTCAYSSTRSTIARS